MVEVANIKPGWVRFGEENYLLKIKFCHASVKLDIS